MSVLIVGPTCSGKSTLIQSSALNEFIAKPPENRSVLYGFQLIVGQKQIEQDFVHYNLLHHALSQCDSCQISIQLTHEPIFKTLLDSGSLTQAIVLVAPIHELLQRAGVRTHIEKELDASAQYNNQLWLKLFDKIDFYETYEQLFKVLDDYRIPFEVVYSSADLPSTFVKSDRVYIHLNLQGRYINPPVRTRVDQVKSLPGCHYQTVQLPGHSNTDARGYNHLSGSRAATFDIIFSQSLIEASILDIGCANGDFLFRAERRGAKRLVGIEKHRERSKAAIALGHLLSSQAAICHCSFFEFNTDERFDYVLALNVIHHVNNIDEFLTKAAALTKNYLVLEFPTLLDEKFSSYNGETFPTTFNNYPFIGVSGPKVDQTYVYSPVALERMVLEGIGGFAAVRRLPSPIAGREILIFSKQASPEQRPDLTASTIRQIDVSPVRAPKLHQHAKLANYHHDRQMNVWRNETVEPFAYSDGSAVEARLLQVVKSCADTRLFSPELARECRDWPSRYHLSSVRANIIRPFSERIRHASVLELGAGCGGITRFLGELGAQVVAVEGSIQRAAINAERCRDLANVSVVVDNLQNFKSEARFDVVTLIGVLEYSQAFITDPDPIGRVLRIARSYLKEDGLLLVAIENQLGLKYFCGAPEDHVGLPMYGINDSYSQRSVITFGRQELTERIARAGFAKVAVYTPFPDYKFPLAIIYPQGLHKAHPDWNLGTLLTNSVSYEPQPFKNPLFSLEAAWQVIARNGLTSDLANSFLIAAYADPQSDDNRDILAAHYSGPGGRGGNLREHRFMLDDSRIIVKTRPLSDTTQWPQQPWQVQAYVPGVKSYDQLIRLVNRPGWALQELIAWLQPWVTVLREAAFEPDAKPPAFQQYREFLPGIYYDAMPTNLIIGPDNKPVLIDFEWEYPTPIPMCFVLHRGLYLSLRRISGCAQPAQDVPLQLSALVEKALQAYQVTFTPEAYAHYLDCFRSFQNRIAGYPEDYDNPLVKAIESAVLPVRGYRESTANGSPETLHETAGSETTELSAYERWQAKHAFDDAKAYLLQQRLATLTDRPRYHFYLFLLPGEEAHLSDTLDSLGQQFYSDWRLTVISVLPSPDPMFDELEMLSWIQLADTDDPYHKLNDVLPSGGQDWVCLIDPGVQLAPECLLTVALYGSIRPVWRFIYCDEDKLDGEGRRVEPHFKPDFNLEMLRSMPYFGRTVFVHAGVLTMLNGMKDLPCAELYDLALRLFEQSGESVFGHIAEVLIHQPHQPVRLFNTQSGEQALTEHWARLGIDAAVRAGKLPDSYFIDYAVTDQLTVAVVIPATTTAEKLARCIASVCEKTDYRRYRVVVLNQHYQADELRKVCGPHAEAVQCLTLPYTLNGEGEWLNAGIAQIDADYIVLLKQHAVVVQGAWLTRLLGLVRQPQTGIVGGALVNLDYRLKHTGVGLGLGALGIGDYWQAGLPMAEPGYCGRAQVTHNVSAVSSDCWCIATALFQSVGGFSTDVNGLLADVDLGLKVIERGYRNVWTPWVTLVQDEPHAPATEPTEAQRAEVDTMLTRWLPQLANDSAYNRHLSLKHRHFQIETETDVTWNPDFHECLTVYAFPGNDSGIGEYRVRAPLRALTQAAMIQSSLLPNHSDKLIPDIVEIERAQPDVLLLQNGLADYLLHAWAQYRRFNRVFQIYAQDDLVYMLPQKHPAQGLWPKDVRRRLRKILEQSDRLIVATEPLKEAFGQFIEDVRLVPNYLEKARWLDLDIQRVERTGKLRVGWAGAGQHRGDLEWIQPVVEATANEVDWVFFGMCPDELRPYVKEFHGGVPFDRYPAKLASLDLDLAIAPLEYNNFNQAKTNLRLLEYGILGWPVLCSDILPYQNAPVTRVGNNPRYWLKAIRERIGEPDALRRDGEVLRQWVLEHFMLEDHLDEWLSALTP